MILMNRFSALLDDIALLWNKYSSSYVSGIANTLLLAVIAFGIYLHRAVKKGCVQKNMQWVLWLVAVACIAVCTVMEFRVDRGSMKWLYYAVMTLCLGVIVFMTMHCRNLSQKWHGKQQA